MRIGIDGSGIFGWRGPSRNIRNIIRSLSLCAQGHELFVFLTKPPDENFSFRNNNLTFFILKYVRLVPWLNVTLPLAAKKYHIEVMLFPQANFWFFKPIPTVILTRAEKIEALYDTLPDKIQAKIARWRFKKVADKVGAVSHYNAHQIHRSYNIREEMFEIINNGVDPVFFDDRIAPCTKYGDYILFCGGTEKRKNVHGLFQAYKILLSRGITHKLVLVGGKYVPADESEDSLGKLTKSLGISDMVILHGIEEDIKVVASIYRGATLAVYPSFQEDFGMVSVEAMACGCPVVASRMPSIPEITGDAAEYFDPYDTVEMAEKIEKVLKDEGLRKNLIRAGKERVKRYSWETSARKLMQLLECAANVQK